MKKLENCPICNMAPILFVDETTYKFILRCPDVDCDFPYAVGNINKELAIKRWNQCCKQWDKEK